MEQIMDMSYRQCKILIYKQDVIYLIDFADCLSRLSLKKSNPTYTKRLTELAIGTEEYGKDMHRFFFKNWMINEDKEVNIIPYTLLYTSYILRFISLKPYAEVISVLLSCFWVYMHVGQKILKLRKTLSDSVSRSLEFDAWIDMYTSDELEKDVTDYQSFVDDFVDSIDCDELII